MVIHSLLPSFQISPIDLDAFSLDSTWISNLLSSLRPIPIGLFLRFTSKVDIRS